MCRDGNPSANSNKLVFIQPITLARAVLSMAARGFQEVNNSALLICRLYGRIKWGELNGYQSN